MTERDQILDLAVVGCGAIAHWHLDAIERAAVLSQSEIITPEFLPDTLFQPPSAAPASTSSSIEEIEREHIMRVLAESPTLQDAAENLGINVTTLWRKRKRYKLD